jgi:ABC-type amino acid transport substrate-binding protein
MLRLMVGALLIVLGATPAPAATLDRIRETETLKIGFRTDAVPFSYRDDVGEAAGYSVELCRAVAGEIRRDLGLSRLALEYVPVSAEDRFEAVQQGRIDLLCGATTVTLSRRRMVDFSLFTFADGAGVLLRADGPKRFEDLAGQKVGVHAATTTEEALRNTMARESLTLEVVTVEDYQDGLDRLLSGEIAAYFADRAILLFLVAQSGTADRLRLAENYLTYESYALALPRGDDEFRFAVDRALSRIYRSGAIEEIFARSFTTKAKPSEILRALYVINGLPE